MILESLPPIAPSIGIGVPLRASTTTSATTTSSASAANNNNNGPDDPTSHDSSAVAANPPPPPPYIRLGNRTIYTSSTARPWSWKAFSSTARADDAQFHHWVPSSIEYADYPYARFDVHLDPLIYTNEEYEQYLEEDGNVVVFMDGGEEEKTSSEEKKKKEEDRIDLLVHDNNRKQQQQQQKQQHLVHSKVYPWTKSETDALLELARAYDLRWPVIVDKWKCQFADVPTCNLRQIEDLQYRYYQVGAILAVKRAEEVLSKEVESIDRNSNDEKETNKKRDVTVPPSTAILASGTIKGGEGDTTVAVVNGVPTAMNGVNVLESTGNNVDTTTNPMESVSSSTLTQQPPLPPPPPPDKEVIEALHRTHRQVAIDPSLALPPLSLPATGTSTHRLRGSNGGGSVAGVGNVVKGAVFDLAAERGRRAQLDRLWHRSKEEEMEEEGLRAELRIVEAQLRKLKRSGKHLVPAGSASAASNAATVSTAGGAKFVMPGGGFGGVGREDVVIPASSSSSSSMLPPPPPSRTMMPPPPLSSSSSSHRPPLDPFSTTHQSVSASFVETAPVPTPGTPYLQSGRLFPPSVKGHSGLNPSTLKQMNAILRELNIPEEPIPTKRNCDLYDGVRKDALTLLILQKIALRKEAELDSKRSMLIEMKGAAAAVAAAAAAAAAAKTAAEESEKNQKKNAENAAQKKEGGNEIEGEKGKKGVAKKAKAKRPRDDSASSNQGGDSATTASTAKGGGKGRNSSPKKEGSAPKKRPRTKAKKDTSTAAASASIPTASSNSLSTVASSVVPAASTVPPLPPPIALPSSAPISPMVTTGKSSRPATDPSSMLPTSVLPPPLRNNAGSITVDASSFATVPPLAPPSSSSAGVPASHPGNTTNKPGKKPRGRKKAESIIK